uniref:DUF4158 domain-containing protein n=1 Tax=Streptomyces chartreusis TaxID=1969 RepID=UPI003F491C1C
MGVVGVQEIPGRTIEARVRGAVESLFGQLGIADAACVTRYAERRLRVCEPTGEIQKLFKYRDFTDRRWGRHFHSFLYGRVWASS